MLTMKAQNKHFFSHKPTYMSIMYTYTLAFFFLLLVSSFLELQTPISVEARKLVSSNGGVFKADLIHRDSPLSPYYIPSLTLKERLKRSVSRSISRGYKIHHSTSYYGYDLVPSEGEYLVKFTLGTPKVEFIALVDTGSDLTWVQCSPCDLCIHQKSPLFDPTKSSTYQVISCNSSMNSNNKSSQCMYEYIYGDGTESRGYYARETITLPSFDTTTSLSLPSAVFGCGFYQNGSLNGGDGIIGIGNSPYSLISQLGQTIDYKFSYCLTPLILNINSKLAFGADVTGTGVVSTPFTSEQGSIFYNLSLDGISIGDQITPVQVSSPKGWQIIIDSGTLLTMLPTNVYSSLKVTLVSAIELSTVPSPIEDFDLCYNLSAQFNPPDVVFHFRGADVVLKAINTFIDTGEGVTCLAMADANGTTPIFGNIAQANFHIGYDLKAKQVSFVPTDCTKF